MTTIFNFIKKAVKAYFRMSAETYTWMYTGCTWVPVIKEKKDNKSEEE